MDGQNYVVFHAGTDNSYMNSSANFRGADVGATFIDLFFASATFSSLATSGYDKVRLTVTATFEESALEGIGAALAGVKNPVMVIADDVNSKYIHEKITAVGSITLATQASTGVIENFLPGGDGTGATGNANTFQLETSDSGKTFIVQMHTNTAAFRLPAVAGAAGVKYQFIMSFLSDAEGTKDFILSTDADAENIMGVGIDAGAVHDSVSTTSVITLDSSAGAVGAGDRLSCICDGTHWYITDASALSAGAWVVADAAI